MRTDPNQPDFTSLGLTEADVAAWVECELPRERHEAVGVAIDSNPVLARRLRAMRADREAVRALPEVFAPEGLLETVEATMERQALLGLVDGVELNNAPPLSIIRTARRPIGEVLSLRLVPIRFAAAAAILLMVASAAYVGIWKLSQPTGTPEPIAFSDTLDAGTESVAGTELVAAALQEPEAQPANEVPSHVTLAQSTAPDLIEEPSVIGIVEALELAAQGRLVIRVTSLSANTALRDLGALAVRPASGTDQWRFSSNVPDHVTAELSPGEMTFEPFSIADDRGFERPVLNIDRPTLTGVYMADARLTPESLESLLQALAEDGRTATFTALDEPIDLGPRPVLLSEIVWWTSSPTDWAIWTRVPVVFEPQR